MNRRTTLAAVLALTAGFALAGCGGDSAPELKVSGAYLPQPVDQSMAGAFMVVENSGGTADKLTSVTSDLSDDVTIHTTKNNKMEQVKSLDIPANGKLELARGGNHLMFMGLKKKPAEGQTVNVELHFATAEPIKVQVPVRSATYVPKNGGGQGGDKAGDGGGSGHGGAADHGSMQHGGSQHEGSMDDHAQHHAEK